MRVDFGQLIEVFTIVLVMRGGMMRASSIDLGIGSPRFLVREHEVAMRVVSVLERERQNVEHHQMTCRHKPMGSLFHGG